MEIVADASIFLAVALNESSKGWVIEKTKGLDIVAPEMLLYEIGNALVSVKRQGRLGERQVIPAFEAVRMIPVRLAPVSIRESVEMALRCNIYAYDAYYLQCCIESGLSLISLDNRMCQAARSLGIKVVE